MLPGLALAALLASSPSPSPSPDASASAGASVTVTATAEAPKPAKKVKKPKPSPEERLAVLDDKRIELHTGVRAYGRYLGAPAAFGGSWQLGLGVRVVRGLYIAGELGLGAHAMPVGVGAQGFIGLRHELRVAKWVRPSISVGYTHLLDASFDVDLPGFSDGGDHPCGCSADHGGDSGFGFDAGASATLASRSGVQAGLGLRFPFKRAPRLSGYLRGDAAYYFDDLPGRLQIGGSMGLQIVF